MCEVAERIESGDPPEDTCRRLAVYADELRDLLGSRDYLKAAGDDSIEATRWRLVKEVEYTRNVWLEQGASLQKKREAEAAAVEIFKEANAVAKRDVDSRRLKIEARHLARELQTRDRL
jgi:hypothetical protein